MKCLIYGIIFTSLSANLLFQSQFLLSHLPIDHANCVTERENVFQTPLHVSQHLLQLPDLHRGNK